MTGLDVMRDASCVRDAADIAKQPRCKASKCHGVQAPNNKLLQNVRYTTMGNSDEYTTRSGNHVLRPIAFFNWSSRLLPCGRQNC
jgi:hypothetical protein